MHFYMLVVWYFGWIDEENNKLIWWNCLKVIINPICKNKPDKNNNEKYF